MCLFKIIIDICCILPCLLSQGEWCEEMCGIRGVAETAAFQSAKAAELDSHHMSCWRHLPESIILPLVDSFMYRSWHYDMVKVGLRQTEESSGVLMWIRPISKDVYRRLTEGWLLECRAQLPDGVGPEHH